MLFIRPKPRHQPPQPQGSSFDSFLRCIQFHMPLDPLANMRHDLVKNLSSANSQSPLPSISAYLHEIIRSQSTLLSLFEISVLQFLLLSNVVPQLLIK